MNLTNVLLKTSVQSDGMYESCSMKCVDVVLWTVSAETEGSGCVQRSAPKHPQNPTGVWPQIPERLGQGRVQEEQEWNRPGHLKISNTHNLHLCVSPQSYSASRAFLPHNKNCSVIIFILKWLEMHYSSGGPSARPSLLA